MYALDNLYTGSEDNIADMRGSFDFRFIQDDVIDATGSWQKIHGIEDVKFETFGCGSAIASSSMATEMIKGKPVAEAMKLTNKAVAEALDGLPAHKMHCSVLAEEAIKAAIEDYKKNYENKK